MKIGILTFHRAHNYGAVLQSYALVKYLRKTGYDAEIIDYRPVAIEEAHGTIPIGILKKMSLIRAIITLIKLLPYLPLRYKRAKVFKDFIDSLPKSMTIYTDTNTSINGYDYILVGSDQVWNQHITQGFSKFYTGKISTKAKWMSYAASAEIKPHHNNLDQYKDVLSNFDKISVREKIFQEQLQRLTDKKIWQVLDPIFLLSKEEWESFANRRFKYRNYILVYQVKRDASVLKYANAWAAIINCEVIEITAEANFRPKKNRYMLSTPQEFVGAFIDSKGVVTTSFHGTAFAALFAKPVKVMKFGKPGDYRALDLLDTIGIGNSVITPKSIPTDVDADEKATRLNVMIQTSKEFLNINE